MIVSPYAPRAAEALLTVTGAEIVSYLMLRPFQILSAVSSRISYTPGVFLSTYHGDCSF